MDRREAIETANSYVDQGFLCVEAVFMTLADMHGTDSDLIPKVASGLAAGIARTSHVCGALTGAILGLGLWFGRNEPVEGDRKPYWYSRRFICSWMELYPETNCTSLLGVDLDDPDGMATFEAENMWDKK
jgi:C_GCAxxG_C_C family probable redox protein